MDEDDYKFFNNSWDFLRTLKTSGKGKTLKASPRNFKCPKCGGEFNSWDTKTLGGSDFICPFCGLERGDYKVQDEEGD